MHATDPCPRCKRMSVKLTTERYGEDADGNRWELREYAECMACGWEPIYGYHFQDDDEEEIA